MTVNSKEYKENCSDYKNHEGYCNWIKCEQCPFPNGKFYIDNPMEERVKNAT